LNNLSPERSIHFSKAILGAGFYGTGGNGRSPFFGLQFLGKSSLLELKSDAQRWASP
jgi:hypothetical protein